MRAFADIARVFSRTGRAPVRARADPDCAQIDLGCLRAIARNCAQPFSSSSYATLAKVSGRTANADLKALEGKGLVVHTGRGRATRWSLR